MPARAPFNDAGEKRQLSVAFMQVARAPRRTRATFVNVVSARSWAVAPADGFEPAWLPCVEAVRVAAEEWLEAQPPAADTRAARPTISRRARSHGTRAQVPKHLAFMKEILPAFDAMPEVIPGTNESRKVRLIHKIPGMACESLYEGHIIRAACVAYWKITFAINRKTMRRRLCVGI